MILKIAVLITCYNRRDKTLTCLRSLFKVTLTDDYELHVFLVDDSSNDGTGDAVKEKFPKVNVIQGNGNLFWNQGMRLAWQTASKQQKFDYFLWLNNDTLLDKNAITELLKCNSEAIIKDDKPAIITGVCRNSNENNEISYGGRNEAGLIIPNGELQQCKYINGNAVLIPKVIYEKLGNLSPEYTHTMGDIDYGLRALEMDFKCYITKRFIATCPTNKRIPLWQSPRITLIKRVKLLYSPKGLNIREYKIFRKKFWGSKWIIYVIKAYVQVIIPSLYQKLSKNRQ